MRDGVSLLDDVVREGARRMLAAALEAEVDAYLAEFGVDTSAHTGLAYAAVDMRCCQLIRAAVGVSYPSEECSRRSL